MPAERSSHAASPKPAAVSRSRNSAAAGRRAPTPAGRSSAAVVGDPAADARQQPLEVEQVERAQRPQAGTANSSTASWPPGATTRASSPRARVEVDDVAQAEGDGWRRRSAGGEGEDERIGDQRRGGRGEGRPPPTLRRAAAWRTSGAPAPPSAGRSPAAATREPRRCSATALVPPCRSRGRGQAPRRPPPAAPPAAARRGRVRPRAGGSAGRRPAPPARTCRGSPPAACRAAAAAPSARLNRPAIPDQAAARPVTAASVG